MAQRAYPYRADIHSKLIQTAAEGRTIAYSELPTSQGRGGACLFRITHEEDAAGRPPLTAVVVHKVGGQPGPGFLEAMQQVAYAKHGESAEAVWLRALAEVHEYWRPKLTHDRDTWPRFVAKREPDGAG